MASNPSIARADDSRFQAGVLTTKRLRDMAAPYNPRIIAPLQLEDLKGSLREFGFVEPIICNRRSENLRWEKGSKPVIVGGHQRVKAATELELESCPVNWVDLDERGERRLNIILNNVTGQFDDEQLRNALVEIQTLGDMDGLGFSDEEVEKILAEFDGGEGELGAGPGERKDFEQMTFILDHQQAESLRQAMVKARQDDRYSEGTSNENSNGNALAVLAYAFLDG